MRKKVLTHFVGFVIMVIVAGIPTSIFGAEYGVIAGCISGGYLLPEVLKYLDKKDLIK